MVILKVLKTENMLFKALSLGFVDQSVYNVIINKQVVATLQPGDETTIELSEGSHKVFFKDARLGGTKSNKLIVNISPENDYVIQAQNGMGGLVASYTKMVSTRKDAIKCENCGAINKNNYVGICEYCGSPLK